MTSGRGTIISGVDEFVMKVRKGGGSIDTTNINLVLLTKAIEEEWELGQQGTVSDIIEDLNGSIGLEQFGIIVE